MDSGIHEEMWPYILTVLPTDLNSHAKAAGALRRARGVRNAQALLRMFLAYGITHQSLKGVVAWASAAGVASISAPALFYRLRDAVDWLSQLLAYVLNDVLHGHVTSTSGYRLRIVDATSISGPGANGTDWRVHALVDPATGRLAAVKVTDQYSGESFQQHPLGPGDLVLADRGYAHAKAIAAAKRTGADVLVRINLATVRLCHLDRQRIVWQDLDQKIPQVGGAEFHLLMPEPPTTWNSHKTWPLKRAASWTPVRVIGARTRNGKPVWLLTTAPADRMDITTALDLYRLRWQIELQFKRLKSLLNFGELPARTEPLARAWLLSRLLAAALVERLTYEEQPFSPWGYRIRSA